MSHHRQHRPRRRSNDVPRAGIDRFRSLVDVFALVERMLPRPLRPQVLVILLDDQMRGINAAVVDEVEDDEAVVPIAELMATTLGPGGRLVLVSVRPDGGLDARDPLRLAAAEHVSAEQGVAVHDWIVWGPQGPGLPRVMAGLPDPWESAA